LAFSCFDSRELAPTDRFEVTRECVRPLCHAEPVEGTHRRDYDYSVKGWNINGLLLGCNRLESGGVRLVRSGRTGGSEGDAVQLFFYRKGGFRGQNGDDDVEVGPGDIGLIDITRGFELEHAPRSEHLTLIIPRSSLLSRLAVSRMPTGLVLRQDTIAARLLASHLQAVASLLPSARACEADDIAESLLSLVAASLGPAVKRRERAGQVLAQATLGAIRDYIESRLDSPQLTVEVLCRRFGCSRAYLYRLFQPFGGIRTYIRERRLERCFRQLSTLQLKRTPIIDVALNHGFTNQSHFSRLFRQRFGISPSEARDRAHAVLPTERDSGVMERERYPAFRRWFAEL
ncbi:MAG: helix-turn-helix domain-containing protein, partial [Pseudomonadota bacterium]